MYEMLMRAHLSGPALKLLNRRLFIILLLTWVPLALLSTIEGHLFGGQNLPFLTDIESHVRFLVALPVLILAEVVVHSRSSLPRGSNYSFKGDLQKLSRSLGNKWANVRLSDKGCSYRWN